MGFLGNAKGSIISEYFKLLDSVGAHKVGDMCEVRLFEDHLIIHAPFVKQEIKLSYGKIVDVFYGDKTEPITSKKSVIKRAIVGGVLTGGIGAVVGGMSGIGDKQKRQTRRVLVISYRETDGKEKFLQFEDTRHYKGKKLARKLQDLTGLSAKAVENETSLEL